MNTDIADRSQELKRIVEAELQYEMVDDLDDDDESGPDKEVLQDVLSTPSLMIPPGLQLSDVSVQPDEGVRPPPGLILQTPRSQPLGEGPVSRECVSPAPVVLNKTKAASVAAGLVAKQKRKLRIKGTVSRRTDAAMGRG